MTILLLPIIQLLFNRVPLSLQIVYSFSSSFSEPEINM